jgi:hypothetical protein
MKDVPRARPIASHRNKPRALPYVVRMRFTLLFAVLIVDAFRSEPFRSYKTVDVGQSASSKKSIGKPRSLSKIVNLDVKPEHDNASTLHTRKTQSKKSLTQSRFEQRLSPTAAELSCEHNQHQDQAHEYAHDHNILTKNNASTSEALWPSSPHGSNQRQLQSSISTFNVYDRDAFDDTPGASDSGKTPTASGLEAVTETSATGETPAVKPIRLYSKDLNINDAMTNKCERLLLHAVFEQPDRPAALSQICYGLSEDHLESLEKAFTSDSGVKNFTDKEVYHEDETKAVWQRIFAKLIRVRLEVQGSKMNRFRNLQSDQKSLTRSRTGSVWTTVQDCLRVCVYSIGTR